MSKFCLNCGAQLDDNTLFCATCGVRQDAAPAAPAAPVYEAPAAPAYEVPTFEAPAYDAPATPAYDAPAPKKGMNKGLLFGIVGAVALIAVGVLVFLLFFSSPYTSAIENMYNIRYGNFDKVESVLPAEVWELLEDKTDRDLDDYIELLEESYDDSGYEDKYGEKVSVSVNVTKEISMPKEMVEQVADYLDDEYEIDADQVKALKKVYYDYTLKGDVYANYVKDNTTYVIQIGSNWYVVDVGYDSSDEAWYAEFDL